MTLIQTSIQLRIVYFSVAKSPNIGLSTLVKSSSDACKTFKAFVFPKPNIAAMCHAQSSHARRACSCIHQYVMLAALHR